jgi:hypothetical protein
VSADESGTAGDEGFDFQTGGGGHTGGHSPQVGYGGN